LTQQRDEFTQQRDELTQQRDELTRQRDELTQQREEIIQEKNKIDNYAANELAEKDRQYNEIVLQLMSLSEKLTNYERLSKLEEDKSTNLSYGNSSNKSQEIFSLRKLYLDLMEVVLTGSIYDDQPQSVFGKNQFDASIRNRGLDWPEKAFSMVGSARIQNFRNLIELAIIKDLPGDIVETGVWRGGASILAKAVLTAYGCKDKKIILCDSFAGLPPPDANQYPKDEGSNFHEFPQLAVSLEQVQENFKKFGLLDDQIMFVKGWFKDTMPHMEVKDIAILRLDGDMYESTLTPLKYLFDRVVAGGWIIIDDYEWIPACKEAVHDFLEERGLNFNIQKIDGVGVYFQKN
jgi:hypothetical protein